MFVDGVDGTPFQPVAEQQPVVDAEQIAEDLLACAPASAPHPCGVAIQPILPSVYAVTRPERQSALLPEGGGRHPAVGLHDLGPPIECTEPSRSGTRQPYCSPAPQASRSPPPAAACALRQDLLALGEAGVAGLDEFGLGRRDA